MKLNSIFQTFLIATAIGSSAIAQVEPVEKIHASVTRVAGESTVQQLFSKNIYTSKVQCVKQGLVKVPYQVSETYTENVPYQVTEYRLENVPYEITEYRTENVPYQVSEQYVESVPYTVDVPYTTWITEYRNETKCESVQETKQVCHVEQDCYLIPGNPPQQQCRDKQVCVNTLVPSQKCYTTQVPYQKEVTRYHQETRYRDEWRTRVVTKYKQEQVAHTITKYREEQVAHTITKYRQETKTRVVTKYKQEQGCVKSATIKEFHHQEQFDISLRFPQDAIIQPGITENIELKLINAEAGPSQFKLDIVSSLHEYVVKNQTAQGTLIDIELERVPPDSKLTALALPQLKDKANLDLMLVGQGIGSALVITDVTKDYIDVNTEYVIYLDLVKNGVNKPLNMNTFNRKIVKKNQMTILLSDIIQYAQVSQTALIAGNQIDVSLTAKRNGTSPILKGMTVKAQKSRRIIIQ